MTPRAFAPVPQRGVGVRGSTEVVVNPNATNQNVDMRITARLWNGNDKTAAFNSANATMTTYNKKAFRRMSALWAQGTKKKQRRVSVSAYHN